VTIGSLALLTLAVFAIAVLYSCVGHAGASGYIAVMSLFGLAPEAIRPTALSLNILVACIGTWQFWRAGHFSWRLFWPFAALSVPCAYLGGYLALPVRVFQILVGLILLLSAAAFVFRPPEEAVARAPSKPVALSVGAGLGLLSGLTGTGGGIFLTPLLILRRWAPVKTAAAVSALFILMNSASGLLGNVHRQGAFPAFALALAAAAACGGFAGSYLGSRRLPHLAIKRLLAVVLVIAGAKLIFIP